jgi:hypothetical protein
MRKLRMTPPQSYGCSGYARADIVRFMRDVSALMGPGFRIEVRHTVVQGDTIIPRCR